jgi:hypothetical protein
LKQQLYLLSRSSPRRCSPYPLKSISRRILVPPHVYIYRYTSSSFQPRPVDFNHEYNTGPEHRQPLPTQSSAEYSKDSFVRTSLPIRSRLLPDARRKKSLYHERQHELHRPEFRSQGGDHHKIKPAIKVALAAHMARWCSRTSSDGDGDGHDEMVGGNCPEEVVNALGLMMGLSVDQVFPPSVHPLSGHRTLLPVITSTSTFTDTGNLAQHSLAQQQSNYNQNQHLDHPSHHSIGHSRLINTTSRDGDKARHRSPKYSMPPLFSLPDSLLLDHPQFFPKSCMSFPLSQSRLE